MTFDPIAVAGMSTEENDLTNRLLRRLDDVSAYNNARDSLYEMRRLSGTFSSLIPMEYQAMGLALGWIAKGVDGLANRCNIRSFTWSDGDLESLGMREFVDSNRALSELAAARTSSLIHGPAFLVNTRGDRAAGEPASLLHSRSALEATGEYDRRTHSMRNLVSVYEYDNGKPSELSLYLPGLTIQAKKERGWSVVDRHEHPHGLPVEVLRYRPRERRPYGASRISRAAMSIQASALRALARLEGHMDVYSWPEFWLMGPGREVFGDATSMQVMLGRIKAIPDDPDADNPRADVKRFEAASPQPHLLQLNALAKMMSREFNLPDSSFALTDYANPTSPDAYTEGRDDLIADAEVAMDEWSIPIRRSIRRGLAMAYGDASLFGRLAGLDVVWRSPLHVSLAAEADAGSKQVASGPEWLKDTEVGLELLGLSDEQIRRAMAEKRRAAGRSALDVALAAAETPPSPAAAQ